MNEYNKDIKVRKTVRVFGILIYKKYVIRYREQEFAVPMFEDIVSEIFGVRISTIRLYYR